MKKNACEDVRIYAYLIRKTILYMKVSAMFLLLALQVSASNYAQRINLKATDISIAEVFKAIENQSPYRFNYSNDMLPTERLVSVNAVNADIKTVLSKIFENTPVRWTIEKHRNVFLSPFATETVAVQIITGTIRNEKGEPVEGATIIVKSSSVGTTSGADGSFTINARQGDVLEISRVGYTTATITVGSLASVDVILTSIENKLDEVVVVGYGTQKKENLTGAIATVNAEALESRPITNLGQGLQGLIPNLVITPNNGRPGTDASFNIRGATSINGGGPLILVDGVQMDPNQVDPNDVASVTILKDAASAAIYGGRAAYGVILITTKKGKKNTPLKIDYSYYYAKTTPTRLPHLVNSLDYVTMYMEADATGRATGGATGSTPFNATDIEKIKAYLANPIPTNAVYRDPANTRVYRYVGSTDWIKELYPSWAPQQQHDLSLSGGTEKTSYRASFGAFNQDGVLKVSNQKFKRYNASININTQATKWMDLDFRMLLNRKENDQPATTSYRNQFSAERFASDLRPIMPIYHPDGHFAGQGSFTNPFAIIASGGREQYQSDDIWLTGGFTIRPIKNISIVGDYTWNSYHRNDKVFIKEFDEYGASPVGSDSTNPANAYLLGKYPWNVPAIVRESNSHDYYIASNIYAQYEKTFALLHYVKAMVGYNYEFKHNESFNARAKTLLNQNYPYLGLNNDAKPVVGGSALERALLGAFFRLNYVFDRKYLLEVNGRYDGSSRFSADKRYVFSPSVSVGWRISEESFFEPLKPVINDLKFRASYGTLPNQLDDAVSNSSYFPYIATMPYGVTGYIFGSEQQAYVTAPGLVSNSFTWENVTSKNLGMDFSLLRNKLTGSLDFYTRDTRNMLVNGFAVPAVLGTNPPRRNGADMRTKGFELVIDWKDRLSNGLRYNIGFNLGDNSAKITKYDLNPNGNIGDYYVGRAIGEIWGYETVGFYATDADAANVDNSRIWGGKWLAGDIQYRNLNGDKTSDGKDIISPGASTLTDPGDRKIIGNSQSRYQYGINLGVDFKGFDFSLLAQGIGKRTVMLGGVYFWGFTDEWDVPTTEQLDFWKPDRTNAYYPRLRFGGGGNFQTQTKYLQNAAYLRLKQLTLGYTIPKTITEGAWIRSARIYFTGQNLFEFTKLIKSYDPEQLDRNSYPINRSLAIGVQIGL